MWGVAWENDLGHAPRKGPTTSRTTVIHQILFNDTGKIYFTVYIFKYFRKVNKYHLATSDVRKI